jgi:predicted negative regulator of RcsB-dependent stress response
MASHLDLEEQEQLDQLKAFWKQYGNLVTWVLILALGGYAAWNGWNYWQRDQGAKAGSLYDELDKAARAGDAALTTRIFTDMKDRYPRATFTHQGGLVAARTAADKGQLDAAKASLEWVVEHAAQDEYKALARLRLAGLLLDEKKYDEALRHADAVGAGEFAALAADRRGDILLAQGKPAEARSAYQKAWEGMDPKIDYRRVVEAKLNVVGASPAASATAIAPIASATAAASGASR